MTEYINVLDDQQSNLTMSDGPLLSTASSANNRNAPTAPMVTDRYAPEYKMCHKERSLALIFACTEFHVDELQPRVQTKNDCDRLENTLDGLNFHVKVYNNLKYDQLISRIHKTTKVDHSDKDCILIAFLTYCKNDLIYATDKCYKIEDIWMKIGADKCPTLAGKPKLIIVDANYGQRVDKHPMYALHNHAEETDGISSSSYKIPIHSDILISTYANPYYSMKPSSFIRSLCAELESNTNNIDFLRLLTFVAQRVFVNSEGQYYSDNAGPVVPSTMTSLTRILHLRHWNKQ